MSKYSKLDEFVKYSRGKFVGFLLQDKKLSNYKFSGKIASVNAKSVEVIPYNGLFRGRTKIPKASVKRLVAFGGLEYNRDN